MAAAPGLVRKRIGLRLFTGTETDWEKSFGEVSVWNVLCASLLQARRSGDPRGVSCEKENVRG